MRGLATLLILPQQQDASLNLVRAEPLIEVPETLRRSDELLLFKLLLVLPEGRRRLLTCLADAAE